MSQVVNKGAAKKRLTLVEQQKLVGVKDPSQHAKRQVGELDKTAKKSKAKRKFCTEQMEGDKKEIAKIDEQLASIHMTYDPLCENLQDKLEKKAHLLQLLAQCKKSEKDMMTNMKQMVNQNMVKNYKQNRQAASFKLELERGFNLDKDSTFRQSKK